MRLFRYALRRAAAVCTATLLGTLAGSAMGIPTNDRTSLGPVPLERVCGHKTGAFQVICKEEDLKTAYREIQSFERMTAHPLVAPHWRRVAKGLPPRPEFSVAHCDRPSYENGRYILPTPEQQRPCAYEALGKQHEWARAATGALRNDPEFQKVDREYEACRKHSDPLMQLLCESPHVATREAYSQVLELRGKLSGADANAAMKRSVATFEAERTRMLDHCRRIPCTARDFEGWRGQLEGALREENQRATREAALAAASYMACDFEHEGRKQARFLTLFKSGEVEMFEPPTNMSGPPAHRVDMTYYGTMNQDAGGGRQVVFQRVQAGSSDRETYLLINGFSGGSNLNDGRLAANIVAHRITFASPADLAPQYVYSTRKGLSVNAPLRCRVTPRPA